MTDMRNEMDSDLDQNYSLNSNADPKNMQELTIYVQNLLQNVQDKFQTMSDQIITRIDDMGNRIDDLEKSIADLMNQAGVEGPGPEKWDSISYLSLNRDNAKGKREHQISVQMPRP